MVNPIGWPIPKEVLADFMIRRIQTGYYKVIQYGPVVFTVGTNPLDPTVHMFSVDPRSNLLKLTRLFMQEVWSVITHRFLIAPIENETMKKIVKRLGWEDTGEDLYDHRIFRIERPR